MSVRRKWAKCAVVSDKIVVIGGCSSTANEHGRPTGQLKTVDIYDPELGKWTAAAPMITERTKFQVAVSKDIVYVMGGQEFQMYMSATSVETYSIETNTWTKVSPHKFHISQSFLNGLPLDSFCLNMYFHQTT